MFEIALLIFVVPFRVGFAARAGGRSFLRWALVGMGGFLASGLVFVSVCDLAYMAVAYLLEWEGEINPLFTSFTGLAAIGVSMAFTEFIRYRLLNPHEPYTDLPPPPNVYLKLSD